MSASYPSSAKAFTSRNVGDVIQAAHINDLQDEVTAVEAALLGTLQHALTTTGSVTALTFTAAAASDVRLDAPAGRSGQLSIASVVQARVVATGLELAAGKTLTAEAGNDVNITAVVNRSVKLNVTGGGTIQFLPAAGGDIQWGKALVALGGGAAPTVGTIGGSGPAAAAQNSWLRALDSSGGAMFLPVWK